MMPSLVVLTDFFAVSNHALSYAAGLALPLHAQLTLLHIPQPELLAPSAYEPAGSYQAPPNRRQTSYALQLLAAGPPVLIDGAAPEDDLPDSLTSAIHAASPLLLVLGQPGSTALPAELMTTMAMTLLHRVAYPLLLVPLRGLDAFPPRRLLLAIDGLPFRLRPHQDVLRRLLQATQGTLDVVHITDDAHAATDAEHLLATLRASDLVPDLPPRRLHQVYQPAVTAGVLAEAARLHADMLVLLARPHSLLGNLFHHSATVRLLRDSPIPVLVLPVQE
ncbi:universal stress protein [Hymenobacter sp. BRD128]|uniref:universal stress protein n=1 Tax=Hymenobacter sp. BRD128 TaxID=2675878 RepID=UPI00156379E7|nr:universal stress protein [Hymenobacter sp. BRD128]QKG55195.1 universal stress protein [Hymenobacter sp. BRD128]QKG55271.1 universal stress protein [Hymenobacter sp. BRD128]